MAAGLIAPCYSCARCHGGAQCGSLGCRVVFFPPLHKTKMRSVPSSAVSSWLAASSVGRKRKMWGFEGNMSGHSGARSDNCFFKIEMMANFFGPSGAAYSLATCTIALRVLKPNRLIYFLGCLLSFYRYKSQSSSNFFLTHCAIFMCRVTFCSCVFLRYSFRISSELSIHHLMSPSYSSSCALLSGSDC